MDAKAQHELQVIKRRLDRLEGRTSPTHFTTVITDTALVPWQETIYQEPGTLTTTAGLPGHCPIYMGFNGSVGWARLGLGTTATGTTIIDILKNGTTIFSDPSHRPALYSGQKTALASGIDGADFAFGDHFTAEVVQVGSPSGADLSVEVGGLAQLGNNAALGAAPSTRYSDAVMAFSPLLYYRLGEASGTTVVDSSGNGHTGTYYGSPTLGSAGALAGDINTAVAFDGVNDYAEGSIDLTGYNSLSVAFWFKASSSPNNTLLAAIANDDWRDHALSFWYDWDDGQFHLAQTGQFFNPSDFQQIGIGATSPATDSWHMAVATLDPSGGGTLKLYLDAAAAGATGSGLGGSVSRSQHVHLMKNFAASSFAAGTLDEFCIIPSVLSLTDVQTLYNAGI